MPWREGVKGGVVDTGSNKVIKGEFFTDGQTFILRLADTPLAGVGPNAQDAFEDLISNQTVAAGLTSKIKALAREQQGERVRASIIRTIMVSLIAVSIAAGALVISAAIAPRVGSEIAASVSMKLIDRLTPEREEKLVRALQRLRALMDSPNPTEVPPKPSPDVEGK